MLTTFDGIFFRLHEILPSLKVQLGGNTVMIEVKVVDAPLDYNLLLGRNWMYSMQAIASSLFRVICFPFNGKIITIDQTSFHNLSDNASSGTSISIIDHSQPTTENVGLGMYPSSMGTFNYVVLILMIISSLAKASASLSSIPFRTSHVDDPWTLPAPSSSGEDSIPTETNMLLSTTSVAYQTNLGPIVESIPSSSWMEEEDPYALPSWEVALSHSHDCFDDTFPMDEAILEAI